MIGRFEEYLKRKRFTLNIQKTKVIKFRKERGKLKKVNWRWKEKR